MIVTARVLGEMETAAKEAAKNAYCPYSKFRVGAAVLTRGGTIYSGCNVENASYGLTICAERSAIFQAVAAEGDVGIEAVVVYTPTKDTTAPCGACRQVINEFGPGAEVYCICDTGYRLNKLTSDLLPWSFGPADLGLEAPGDPQQS